MDISHELQQIKTAVDREITSYLDDVMAEVDTEDRAIREMLMYTKKMILSGGKRIRPAMMQYGYLLAGGRINKRIIRASISIELIHTFLLMHDDIIDRDDMRHGVKTIHAKYRGHAQHLYKSKDADHFGISIGIIAGDFAYALGNDVLFSVEFPPEKIILAMQKLQSIVGHTALGEMQDVIMEYKQHATEQEIFTMYTNKTARYTFEGPLQLGAILAGEDNAFCAQISTFAVPLGIAFQLQDDIIGIYGASKKTGKPVGSDIAEGKVTLLVVRAYKNATKAQKKVLDHLLGKADITTKEVQLFRTVLHETGAYESVYNEMEEYLTTASKYITKIEMPRRATNFFDGLIAYLRHREH